MFRKRRFGNFGCRLSPSLKEKVTCIEIEVNEFKPVGEESQASLVSLGISFKQEREQQKAIRDMSTSELNYWYCPIEGNESFSPGNRIECVWKEIAFKKEMEEKQAEP